MAANWKHCQYYPRPAQTTSTRRQHYCFIFLWSSVRLRASFLRYLRKFWARYVCKSVPQSCCVKFWTTYLIPVCPTSIKMYIRSGYVENWNNFHQLSICGKISSNSKLYPFTATRTINNDAVCRQILLLLFILHY